MAFQRWQLLPGVRLHWRMFGDEVVVFDAYSGATHLLDPLAAAALGCLETGGVWTAARLRTDLDDAADADALTAAADRLVRMELAQVVAAAGAVHAAA